MEADQSPVPELRIAYWRYSKVVRRKTGLTKDTGASGDNFVEGVLPWNATILVFSPSLDRNILW
jgi:hypothetical protein